MTWQNIRKNRGDTIIEVMIVLAVLGLAISISYATANRSLLAARQAQENAKATQILHQQVELLRLVAPTEAPDALHDIFKPAGYKFCIKNNAGDYQVVDSATDPACKVDGLYAITIEHDDTPANTFTFRAAWPDVAGQGDDTVQMNYRVHKP